jgi:Raf kinase inhibitor-like YbhB/YbcL family protein
MPLTLTSPEFSHHGSIPSRFTADGDDVSPPLHWSGAPAGTKSFALVMDDPDAPDPRAPKRTWVHWVVYDIPRDVHTLDDGASIGELPSGAREGRNDWGRPGYGGPSPPIGRHRYFVKLYALDEVLPDLDEPTKPELERAMTGHVLEKAELVGMYERVERKWR